MKRNWYTVKAAAESKPAVMSIYDDIGMWGVSASAFLSDLRNQSGPLEVEINSLGGSVFDGVAIYNGLKRYGEVAGNSVTVTVMGIAASIASVIAMAGSKIRMPANSFLMVHKPWGGLYGNADEMRDYAELLDKIEMSLVGTYMSRTGMSEDDVKSMLAQDTWLTAEEAVAKGLADEVLDAIEVNASFEPERLPDNVRALYGVRAQIEPPAGDPDDDLDDADDSSVVAEEALALVTAAGFQAYAPVMVLNAKTLDDVKARIARATEINARCALAGMSGEADALITADKTVAEASTHLINALAARDDAKRIDPNQKISDKPTPGVQPAAVTTAVIWAARRNPGATK